MATMYPGAPPWLVPILNPLRSKVMKLRQNYPLPVDAAGRSAQEFWFEFERVREEHRRTADQWFVQYISTGRWPAVPEGSGFWVAARLEFALEQLALLRRLPGFDRWPPLPRETILEWLLLRAWASAGVRFQREATVARLSLSQRFRVPGDAPPRSL